MNMSRKQRMNTRSTTESEVVGVSDNLPKTIWLMRFLEAQGYKLNLSIMYQDNEAAIKMERNGKKSSSRRARHFDIRFSNAKDKLQEHNIKVVYCPREKMVAEFFTMPLQAAQFCRLRRIIMGMDPISILDLSKTDESSPKERIGDMAGPGHQQSVMPQSQVGEAIRPTTYSYADSVKGKERCHI